MVYYRTYRPQTIAQLDSPKLRETLTAVLSQKNIPHAFLFTGPKGLGKTSTARIIAKVLNCTSPKRNGIEPCNACEQCVSITKGNNIDVLEIDGASNRGIDEIRDLRERVNLAPSAAKMKVYIIDEVHMLTTEAFNALLKTIEEPPAHVVFIFATTEPQKVPATIISRCFHISLSRATQEELLHALTRIKEKEKIEINDDALALIAQLGDGGYRDATKIFEEVVALSGGKKITKEIVESATHINGVNNHIVPLLQSLQQKDVKACLETINKIVEQGNDVKYFLSELLNTLHVLLLTSVGVSINTAENVSSLSSFTPDDIRILVTLFSTAYQQTKFAVVSSLPLELAVVQYCSPGHPEQSAGSLPTGRQVNSTNNDEIAAMQVSRNDVNRFTVKEAIKKEQTIKVNQVLRPTKPEEKKKLETTHTQEDLPQNVHDVAVLMENLIYKVKPYNHSVAGVLRGCQIKNLDAESIIFQTAYKFHKEKLDEQKTKQILEQIVREVTGKSLKVMIELKK